MNRRFVLAVVFGLILTSSSLLAQDKKFEINGLIGYTFSEGVDFDARQVGDLVIDRLSPKSAFSYGLGMDYFLTENFSVGFNFGQEQSKLRARVQGLEGLDLTEMDVNNFHGLFTYTFGDEDEPLRPFIFGGLGATNYSPDTIDGDRVEGGTRFSTTWGGGVKYFTGDTIGFRGGVRWTPTHISSEPGGIWCSPYWPWDCWVLEKANYSHQFELSVGVVVRF
jgi:opacity protein-like surface antigen